MHSFPLPTQVLIPADDLRAGIRRLGERVVEHFDRRRILLIPVLNGAFRFASELVGGMEQVPLEIEPVIVQSYVGTESAQARIDLLRLKPDQVRGMDVLLVDDILDTGQTLRRLITLLKSFGPASMACAVMLRKEDREEQTGDLHPEFVGWNIPDQFVVGMGLDYRGFYRNLPYIGVLGERERAYVDGMLDGGPLSSDRRGPPGR